MNIEILRPVISSFLSSHWWVIPLILVCILSIREALSQRSKADALKKDIAARTAALSKKEKELTERELYLERSKRGLDDQVDTLRYQRTHINDLVRERIAATVTDISKREYLLSTPAFLDIAAAPDISRLVSSLTQEMRITPPFDITSSITSQSGETYHVSLHSCTCKDFQIHHRPCKHMYRLATEVGALINYNTDRLKDSVSSLGQMHRDLIEQNAQLEKDILRQKLSLEHLISRQTVEIEKLKKQRSDIENILSETSQSYPWLAKLYADYYYAAEEALERRILNDHPRSSRVEKELAPLRSEKRTLLIRSKMAEYQLHYYETLFPWLEDFKEVSPKDAHSVLVAVSNSDIKDDYDLLRPWLSPEEYEKLPNTEKYQLALDRFQLRTKTKWEVGIEYERYIGYLCEKRGYKVTYSGATMGLEDLGRDLILSKQDQHIVVQCKRWSQEKIIHEKHIFQLFGSCILMEVQNGRSVRGVFVTTTGLSNTARQCAEHLGIVVYEHIPASEYPVIKCNVSRTGEKIYHLPFDQQYDRVVIDQDKGEFYAMTVSEAEQAGFRRAFRHKVK